MSVLLLENDSNDDAQLFCSQQCRDAYYDTFAIVFKINDDEEKKKGQRECFCSNENDLQKGFGDTNNNNESHEGEEEEKERCDHRFLHVDCQGNDNHELSKKHKEEEERSQQQQQSKQSHNLCPDLNRFYCQTTNRSIDDRVNNFMSYMTLDDKIKTLGQISIQGSYSEDDNGTTSPLIAREYVWWSESLHGLEPNHIPGSCGSQVCPTSFPEANSLSQSWNKSLWKSVASAISTEARAYWNVGANKGLTFYAPNLNMASHPLWGRVMETPGEDPYLTSVYAKMYIGGLQHGDDDDDDGVDNKKEGRVLKAAATPKHFVGHFLEGEDSDPWSNGTIVSRVSNDTRFTLQDLEEYYLPPFQSALMDAKAESFMCAYASVNGVPMCANGFLLNRLVRQTWNWTGFIVSDCDAIESMTTKRWSWNNLPFHAYSLDDVAAVQDGIRAGTDQNCGYMYHKFGEQAVEGRRLTEKQIDTSLRRQLRTLFRLGLFGPPEDDPYRHLGWKDVKSDYNKQLALEAARQSVVLLQNGKGSNNATLLPIANGTKVLLTGPMYNATLGMLGNYYGGPCPAGDSGDCMETLESLLMENTLLAAAIQGVPPGCEIDTSGIEEAVEVATKSGVEAIILGLGGQCHEGEGRDRDFLHLPGSQIDLFKALYKTGVPLVVVLVNGGPYAIDELTTTKTTPDIAILQAGFPGELGAQAIVDIILGRVNPSGKLTSTIYPSTYANGKPMSGTPWMDSAVRPRSGSEGRSYMFYTGEPLFPFGYGLSYTAFDMVWDQQNDDKMIHPTIEVSGSELHSSTHNKPVYKFKIRLTNTGAVEGREVVQAYWRPPKDVDGDLQKVLFSFDSTGTLQPGESSLLEFDIPKISTVTQSGDRVVMPGRYPIEFSRGHGKMLTGAIVIMAPHKISEFPSPWVEKHEITVDACVEGTTEVVPHDESFLMAYKRWKWEDDEDERGRLIHEASGKCMTFNADDMSVILKNCMTGSAPEQMWTHNDVGNIIPALGLNRCLQAQATTPRDLRTPVLITSNCSSPSSQWKMTNAGLLQNKISDSSARQGLCLAARNEGRFNYS